MFTYRHYVPVLKWKQGEYQALSRLSSTIQDNLTPLLEIPPVARDFDTKIPRKSIDDHLREFGRRLKTKWSTRPCFVDTKYIDPATRMTKKRHFTKVIFEHAREEKCRAIPVVSLSNDAASLVATATVIRIDRRGVALRLTLLDFNRPDLASEISGVLAALGVGYADAHLIIDLGAPNFQPISAFVQTALIYIGMIPRLNRWQTFTIAGGSHPATLTGLEPPFQEIPRLEWLFYRELVDRLGSGARIPSFGDYATAHPDLAELDMRIIKPSAKLRYTSNDFWHIGKGTNVRDDGFSQYRQLCGTLVNRPYFDGPSYSAGDAYIAGCTQGTEGTGSLMTWVWVATNRHLTKVVNDLATFHAP